MIYHFKDFKELRAFMKGPKEFKEPERLEVKDEVPPKPRRKRKPKADAPEMGKSAEDKG